MESNLHYLMDQFLHIGDASAGRGPLHPTEADPTHGREIEAFISGFPALRRDADYLSFLRSYAGAMLSFPCAADEQWMAMLPGFDELNSGALTFAEEGYGVAPDGFLLFAKLFRPRRACELSFGFYVTGGHEWGVYRLRFREKCLRQDWYCESFLAWLRGFVDKRELLFDEP